MALFKIHEGAAANLNTAAPVKYANKGFAYFTKDDGKFYIDVSGNGSTIATIRDAAHPNGNRVPLNAYKSDIATLANFANVSSRIAFGTCTTAANETNKIVIIDSTELDNLQSGSMIAVYFLNENTVKNPQLSIDTVLYPIQYNYTNAVGTTPYSAWSAGSVKIFTYMAAENANQPGKFVLTNPSLDVNSAKNLNFYSINYLKTTVSGVAHTLSEGWYKICNLDSGPSGGSIILNFRGSSYPSGFDPLSATLLINFRANTEPSIIQLGHNALSSKLDQIALVNLKTNQDNTTVYGKFDLYIHVNSTITSGTTPKYFPGLWLEVINNNVIIQDQQNILENTALIDLNDGYPDINISIYSFQFNNHYISTLDSIEAGALTSSNRTTRIKATSAAGSISLYSNPSSNTLGISGYDLRDGSSSLALIRFDSTDATINAIRPFKTDLNPTQDETYSLGTSSLKWKNVYAANVYGNGSELTNLNASNLTSGTVAIARLPSASTTAKGVVQLNDTTNSTSTTIAATANAVKKAYDLAVAANTAANTDKYWANIQISNNSSIKTEPSFKTITITDTSANAHIAFSREDNPNYIIFPNNERASIRIGTNSNTNGSLYHFGLNAFSLLNDTYINKEFLETDTQPLIYATANSNNTTTPIIFINGQNVNSSILRIAANAAIDSTYYGFDLSYLGANSGINNSLQLTADNSNQDTKKIAFIINQNGQIGFGASPNTDNQIAVEGNGYFNGDVTATSFLGNGANLTNLNASNVSSGTLNVNRLPASGVTAKAYGPNANIAPGYSNTFNVPYITVDAKGRITAASNIVVTLPPEVTLQSLGLTNAMHFIGKATANITDGSTANPNITNYDFSKKQPGDVIIDSNNNYEYVWTTADKWEKLGPDGSYKVIQSNVNTAATGVNQWASQINQNENGEISVTYSSLNTTGIWSGVSNRAIGANISTNPNSIAYYTNATGAFGSIATTSGAFYATAANTVPSFGILPIAYGGTNAANARDAANNLQVASLANGISIPNTADLDTYTTPGNFYCSTSKNAQLIKHTPGFDETTLVNDNFVAFTMKVGLASGTSYPYQEIKVYSTGVRWYRYFKSTTEEWQSWHEFSDTKVTQSNTNATVYKKVLLSYQSDSEAGAASTTDTNIVYKTPLLEYLPSQGRLFATGVSGKAMEYTAKRGNYSVSMGFGEGNSNHGLYSWVKNDWMIFADANGAVRVKGSADTLTTGRTLKVNLASTSASTAFNGSANITDIGVSGILGVANGGTGNGSFTQNRMIYSETNAKLSSSSIYADASHLTINGTFAPANSGVFQVIGTSTMRDILPEANNTYSLGTSNYKWANIYATTFNGSGSGITVGSNSGYAVYTTTNGQLTSGSLATSSPNVGTTPTLDFIATVSQDAKGKLTITKQTVKTMTGSNATTAGARGLVPEPGAGTQNYVLYGNGTWKDPILTIDNIKTTKADGNYAYTSGNVGHITGNHIPEVESNKTFYPPATAVKIEYSTDAGSTWTDYGATDDQKVGLFTENRTLSFALGKGTSTNNTNDMQLRVTIEPTDRYARVDHAFFFVSTSGNSSMNVSIECSTIGAKTTFSNLVTDVPIAGWSGPNIVYFPKNTFGGSSTQTTNKYAYRFTFKQTVAEGRPPCNVSDIRLYGDVSWTAPNYMMRRNHLYTWDNSLNATFPAGITATSFSGNADTATKLASTPNNTTTFLRGDNTWSNTLDGSLTLGVEDGNSTSSTILMRRVGVNYIRVPTGGSLAFAIGEDSTAGSTCVKISPTSLARGNNYSDMTLGANDAPWKDLYIGTGDSKGIYFVGTNSTNRMITFLDNTGNNTGNGIKIGGGGITVVGSGESANNLSVTTAGSETLYLLSDGAINIEAGGDSIANRTGIQITSAGNIVPVKAEANNSNVQTLGSSSSIWANIFTRRINQAIINGTHTTTGGDHGDSENPRYFPDVWTFNAGITPSNGDIITIKTPGPGHNYGVFLSTDNGTNYYPITSNGTTRLTTAYGTSSYITLLFDSSNSATAVFAKDGQNNTTGVTVTGGTWRVINYYDSGNPGDWNLRQNTIKAADAIRAVHLIGGTESGYKEIDTPNTFDIRYPVLFANSNINSTSTGNNNYIHHYNVNVRNAVNTYINNLTPYKALYIKGTISGNTFTPISGGNPYVQDIVESDDGYMYYYIGRAQSSTTITFDTTGRDIYFYRDNKIQRWGSGRGIKTISRSGTTFTATRDDGSTLTVSQVDTKNTAGSTDTSNKIFLIGATAQEANLQTYSDDQVYVTSGTLTTNKIETQGIYIGTPETNQERRAQINTVAGSLYLFSGSAVTANRGLYIRNAENNATYGFSFDQNNAFNNIAKFATSIIPAETGKVNLGSTSLHWKYGFFNAVYVSSNNDYDASTANAPGVTLLTDGGIRITTSNPGYTTIRSAATVSNSSAVMYFPNYNGTGYLVHTASSSAVGNSSQPVYIAANGRVTAITGAIDNDINGNANSATQLKTARYFSITGGATANAVSFNGQANVALTVTSLDATKLSGTIPIGNLPQGALERLVVVANQTARFALTTSNVQLGDVVKQTDTGVMYYVKDETKLNSAAGYEMFKAGEAASVDWSNINNKPNVNDPTASGTGIEYISNVSQNAGIITATKSTVRSASISQTGVVQLSSATNSTSETLAATAKAVKTTYDLANSHKYWANIEATSAATYNKTPEVANIKINGDTSATATSSNNVQLVYDSNLEILNFVFS